MMMSATLDSVARAFADPVSGAASWCARCGHRMRGKVIHVERGNGEDCLFQVRVKLWCCGHGSLRAVKVPLSLAGAMTNDAIASLVRIVLPPVLGLVGAPLLVLPIKADMPLVCGHDLDLSTPRLVPTSFAVPKLLPQFLLALQDGCVLHDRMYAVLENQPDALRKTWYKVDLLSVSGAVLTMPEGLGFDRRNLTTKPPKRLIAVED